MEIKGEKTFDSCLNCQYLGSTCGGANFLAMTHERWVEWCNERRKILGLSLKKIAEECNLPDVTISRALSKNSTGASLETVKCITKVMVGGTWGKFPCADPPEADTELLNKLKEKDGAINVLKEDDDKKVSFLLDLIKEKKRIIKGLSAVVGILGAVLIAVLMIDVFNPFF
jgi:transcriptional regulator with XRE-family HTH domain